MGGAKLLEAKLPLALCEQGCVVVEWMAAELMARTLLEVNAACCEVALRNRVLAVLMVGELCQE